MDAPPAPIDAGRPAPRRRFVVAGVALAAAAVVGLLVTGLLRKDDRIFPVAVIPEASRVLAPDLTLPVLTDGDLGPAGAEVALTTLRGRPVVLNFWASWCVPCRDEAPVLNALASERRDVAVVGVDVRDLSDDARAFVRRERVRFATLRDRDDRAYRAYRLTGVPETFVIDRAGRLAAHLQGPVTGRDQAELLALALKDVA